MSWYSDFPAQIILITQFLHGIDLITMGEEYQGEDILLEEINPWLKAGRSLAVNPSGL